MERVLGIGGYFVRSDNPERLLQWYRDVLGMDLDGYGEWRPTAGPTVMAAFDAGSDYFGSATQQTMINFRVGNLDAMLGQVRASGSTVSDEIVEMDGVGRFAWVTDPDGRRVELWQPAA